MIYVISIAFTYIISAVLYAIYYQQAHIAIKILSFIIYPIGNFAVLILYILSRKKYLFNINYTEIEKLEIFKGTRNIYIALIPSIISFLFISKALSTSHYTNGIYIYYFDLASYLALLLFTIPSGFLIAYLLSIFHKFTIKLSNTKKVSESTFVFITVNIISMTIITIVYLLWLFNYWETADILPRGVQIALLFNLVAIIIYQIRKFKDIKKLFIILQISQIFVCLGLIIKCFTADIYVTNWYDNITMIFLLLVLIISGVYLKFKKENSDYQIS